MNIRILTSNELFDIMRIFGRKKFTRLLIVFGILLILTSVVILSRNEESPLFSLHMKSPPVLRNGLVADSETKKVRVSSSPEAYDINPEELPKRNIELNPLKQPSPFSKARNDESAKHSAKNAGSANNNNRNKKYREKNDKTNDTKGERIPQINKSKTSTYSSSSSPPSIKATSSSPPSRLSSSTPPSKLNVSKAASTASNESEVEYYDQTSPQHERFLIYVCDKTEYCYGLGDRQRAVSSLYVLALLTNRTFGVIWTHPCPLTQFLQPNEVNWDIPAWKLNGKSSIDLKFLKSNITLNFQTPFNKQYPQDVVYIRTNHNVIKRVREHPRYQNNNLPSWAQKRLTYVVGYAWRMLMKPTDLTRKPLNEMLGKIFQDQHLDERIVDHLRASKVCRDACESLERYEAKMNSKAAVKNGAVYDTFNDTRWSADKGVTHCLSEIWKTKSLRNPGEGPISESTISWRNLNMFCKSERFKKGMKYTIANKKINVKSIKNAKSYDAVDLNLVCIHARIGRNPDMPFDNARNSIKSTRVLWDFARPYMERGQHLYIATDCDQVRQDSRRHFGLRAHSSNKPIVHIATIQEHQNETEGMTLALWEQLLLMTSCKTLVQSHSGFSIMAGSIREDLVGNKERYVFDKYKIRKTW